MRFSGFLCVVYVMCKLFREDRWVFNGGNDIKKKNIYNICSLKFQLSF